jgi:hypothetical protein
MKLRDSTLNRVYQYLPGQEDERMDAELPCGFAICVGTLNGVKPHYVLIQL